MSHSSLVEVVTLIVEIAIVGMSIMEMSIMVETMTIEATGVTE
jgi:hypothetical protein